MNKDSKIIDMHRRRRATKLMHFDVEMARLGIDIDDKTPAPKCTKNEIEKKRREALERLAKTKSTAHLAKTKSTAQRHTGTTFEHSKNNIAMIQSLNSEIKQLREQAVEREKKHAEKIAALECIIEKQRLELNATTLDQLGMFKDVY